VTRIGIRKQQPFAARNLHAVVTRPLFSEPSWCKRWCINHAHTRITEAQLREFLRVEHGSTLPRFDVMAALHRSDDDLTMTELSRKLLVSNGNTTTVVDRLESDGLVARTPSAADRRVVHVSLTEAGRRHFAQLAVDHEAHVDSLFSGVSTSDLDALDELLQRMTRNERHVANDPRKGGTA
jgi:DNA-binding MarR family transcriptional regulator